ncbi:hypothetical protein Taro_056536 [Colocasia esculenta]|uniref:Uncharacterized protein n=1 Tax=Colocasia esculenta TaxID=4460 RepID=A0A843XWQ7_COLES|nr:hypothetical protein [Colocasia esculenta]
MAPSSAVKIPGWQRDPMLLSYVGGSICAAKSRKKLREALRRCELCEAPVRSTSARSGCRGVCCDLGRSFVKLPCGADTGDGAAEAVRTSPGHAQQWWRARAVWCCCGARAYSLCAEDQAGAGRVIRIWRCDVGTPAGVR